MKTQDEIKKGIECCSECSECKKCPYHEIKDSCVEKLFCDVHAYIQQLERERDEAVEDLETMGEARAYCDTCLHNNTNHKEEPCISCMSGYLINNWQWRGVEVE